MSKLEELRAWIESQQDVDLLLYKEPVKSVDEAISVSGYEKSCFIKTVIMKHKQEGYLVGLVIPAGTKVDKRALKDGVGPKRWTMADYDEILERVGFPIGGIPPLFIRENLKNLYVDPRVLSREFIIGGGGDEYSLIKLSPRHILDQGAEERIVSFG